MRDFIGRIILLLQRGSDGRCVAVDFTHPLGIAPDRIDRNAGRALDRFDLACNLLGRLCGLHGERFDFRCYHSKAAAGLARARRLDGGIKRQQIGLSRDTADQTHDLIDLLDCIRELRHVLVRRLRFDTRMRRDFSGLADLTADFSDRRDQLFSGTRRGNHVCRRFVRRQRGTGGAVGCVAGRIRQSERDRLERRRAVAHRPQNSSNAFAKGANFGFYRDPPSLLLGKGGTFPLGLNTFGNIVMRADPVSPILDWTVDDQHGTAIRRLHNTIHDLALANGGHNLGAIFFRINVQASGRDPVLNEIE